MQQSTSARTMAQLFNKASILIKNVTSTSHMHYKISIQIKPELTKIRPTRTANCFTRRSSKGA